MSVLEQWLNEVLSNGKIRKDYICYLVYANRGFEVYGWGFTSSDKFGHPVGLEKNEALDLIMATGFIDGLVACGIDFHSVFKPIYKEYCFKVLNNNIK